MFGPSALSHLLRIKDRKVLPDDLGRRVALDPLGAGVPGGYPAVGIEHKDCVIGDAFDQKPKAFFASAQVFFVAASLRQVARDLGEPYKLTLGISQGRDDYVRPEQASVLPDAPPFVFEYPACARYLEFVLRQSAC